MMDRYRPEQYGNDMPNPCANCAGFHYGRCFHPPRQCWYCSDFGHIQRYCLRKARYRQEAGPLPGTRLWCEQHGLNQDQELKRKVLDAIKTLPGAAIFIDNTCVLPGKQAHISRGRQDYHQDHHRQGRNEQPLADRMTRPRSRSPSRERARRERSRSPLYGRRRSASVEPVAAAFPARQLMPQCSRSNTVAFEVPRFGFHQQSVPQNSAGAAPRVPLGEISNVRAGGQGQTPMSLQREEEWIEDPYFVLGVDNGASEEQIAEAFEQRIWEIDQQRMGPAGRYEDKWSSSVRMLEAARRQLVGYSS